MHVRVAELLAEMREFISNTCRVRLVRDDDAVLETDFAAIANMITATEERFGLTRAVIQHQQRLRIQAIEDAQADAVHKPEET